MICRKVTIQQIVEGVRRKNALFDALDQAGTRNVDDAGRVGHTRLQGEIPLEAGCRPRGHHKDFPVPGLHACGLDGWLYAHDRNLQFAANAFDAGGCRCVACNKDGFCAMIRKCMGTAHRKLRNFGLRAIPIRRVAVIAIVDEPFMREDVKRLAQYAYPAKAGIKYADRAIHNIVSICCANTQNLLVFYVVDYTRRGV